MTILVTGGSKGIGRGIAMRFARDGDHVLVNYATDDAAANATADKIVAVGGSATLLKCDLSTPDGVRELARRVREVTSKLDQVVHGAVWPLSATTTNIDIDDFSRAVFTNGSSLLAMAQELRPLLFRGSSLFHLSSRGSKVAPPNYVAVGAPKALAEALVRYLAVSLAPDGIRVNTVSCSGVLTDAVRRLRPNAEERDIRMAAKNPSRRNVTPADVAAMIHHLASADMEMVTGREFFVDGGIYMGVE